ncbi:MAG: MFS transporter [Corynebacterium sp.]|nr:MFS transporter [Corynebacterium sp.]
MIGAVAFSKIGAFSYAVVMTWAVSRAAGNDGVGWVNAIAGLTIVIVGFFATFWLDRCDKRNLLLVFDAVSALVCFAAAALLVVVPTSNVFWIAVGVAVATSVVASLYSPTSRALIPSVVPPAGLERFNSVYTRFGEVSRAAGPAVGTVILAGGGADAFALSRVANGLSFVISLVLTLPLPPVPAQPVAESSEKNMSFSPGFRFIATHPALRSEVLSALAITFFLTSTTFILLNRIAQTGAEAYAFGLVKLCEAIGALVASIIAERLRRVSVRQLLVPITGVLLLCLGGGIWPTVVALTVLAVLMTVYNILLFSRLQRDVPIAKMGRVIAVVTTSSAALMSLGNVFFANLSNILSTNMLIGGISAALVIVRPAAGLRRR